MYYTGCLLIHLIWVRGFADRMYLLDIHAKSGQAVIRKVKWTELAWCEACYKGEGQVCSLFWRWLYLVDGSTLIWLSNCHSEIQLDRHVQFKKWILHFWSKMRKINCMILLDIKLQDNFATCDLRRSIHTTAGIKDLHACIYKMTLLLIGKRKKEERREGREGGKENKRK